MKKKVKELAVIFLVGVIGIFVNVRESQGVFTLWDGKIEIKSYYELLTGIHVQDNTRTHMRGAGDLAMFRNTLQIEPRIQFTKTISWYGILRQHYEGLYDMDHGAGLPSGVDRKWITRERPRDILRECYFDLDIGDALHLRIGKQQVVWGESDTLRMSDIINPLDYSWHFILESWEEIRRPLWLADFAYRLPFCLQNELVLELVVIPFDFQATRFPKEGTNWSFPGYPQNVLSDLDKQAPDNYSGDNCEVGVRLKGKAGSLEWAIFNFYTRMDSPVGKIDFTLPYEKSGMVFKYPRMNVTGGSFNYFVDRLNTVIRGECGLNWDQSYSRTKDISFLYGAPPGTYFGPTEFTKKDTLGFMIGFDRPTWIFLLNKKHTFYITAQYFHNQYFNRDKNIKDISGGDFYQDIFTYFVNTTYFVDTLTLGVGGAVDLSGNGLVNPEISWKPGTNWRYSLGFHGFYGRVGDGYFGNFQSNNQAYLRVRYEF